MAQDLLAGERVLAFDLETTGISTNNDRIVQLALIGVDIDEQPIHFETLVNPRMPIPYGATNVHGIHDSDVRGEGDFSTIADKAFKLIEGSVIIGHNARNFDMKLINSEFLRLGRLPPKPKVVLDTLEVVRRLKLARPHNLGALCKRYGISLENAHTAAADAAASMLLFWRLTVDHPSSFRRSITEVERWLINGEIKSDASAIGRGINDLSLVDPQGRIRKDGEQYVVAFGRHKGKEISQIISQDPSYLNWLLSPKGIEDDATRELIRTQYSL
ncbi:MAG: exonuclease domain-containing protein [Candidatus Poseidoniaceae archaeon]|jgi:DNA polymerase-3 subunit epsilon